MDLTYKHNIGIINMSAQYSDHDRNNFHGPFFFLKIVLEIIYNLVFAPNTTLKELQKTR